MRYRLRNEDAQIIPSNLEKHLLQRSVLLKCEGAIALKMILDQRLRRNGKYITPHLRLGMFKHIPNIIIQFPS